MLQGGLMPHRPYLIVGPAGTGKTTLALQFLCEGVRRGEHVLYVTVEDPPNEVRFNHRALRPELDRVDVFDAIPDVMRYEHTPFKDISSVRQIVPFSAVPESIRQSPEFSSVEVTGTALEQIVRSEVQRRGYSRIVIDSLTALQYFCMKGFDPTVGAQTFLRFLTDLRTTTLLTVEAPLEDVETPERLLARGEIRLFRWELDGTTVRAVGVEKLRGSSHDVRLHPYRIASSGLDVQLGSTISRDTRRIVGPELEVHVRAERAPLPTTPEPAPLLADPLSEQIDDLVVLGLDVSPLRGEVEAALRAVTAELSAETTARMTRLSALVVSLLPVEPGALAHGAPLSDAQQQALRRVRARSEGAREGIPPNRLPPADVLRGELERILQRVSAAPAPPPAPATVPTLPPVPPAPPSAEAPLPVPLTPAAPLVRGGAAGRPPTPAPTPAAEPAPGATPSPGTSHPPRATAGRPTVGKLPPPARPPRVPRPIAFSEPPPLPTLDRSTVASGHPEKSSVPAPTGAGVAPATDSRAAEDAPARPASTRKRKRGATTRRPSASALVPPEAPASSQEATSAAEAKPRKRPVRRRKAPPVVSAAPVGVPSEPSPRDPSGGPPALPNAAAPPTEGT